MANVFDNIWGVDQGTQNQDAYSPSEYEGGLAEIQRQNAFNFQDSLQTNAPMTANPVISNNQKGFSSSMALASQMNARDSKGSTMGIHGQAMETAGTKSALLSAKVFQAYAKAGVEVPASVISKLNSYSEQEAQFNRIQSTDSRLLGAAVSPNLNPLSVANNLTTTEADIYQMTAPVLTYEDRLSVITKENITAQTLMETHTKRLELLDKAENRDLMAKTADIDNETLNKMLSDPVIRQSYGVTYTDALNIKNLREAQKAKALGSSLKDQKAYEKEIRAQALAYKTGDELSVILTELNMNGGAVVDGVPLSNDLETIQLITSTLEAIEKGVPTAQAVLQVTKQQDTQSQLQDTANNTADQVLEGNLKVTQSNVDNRINKLGIVNGEIPQDIQTMAAQLFTPAVPGNYIQKMASDEKIVEEIDKRSLEIVDEKYDKKIKPLSNTVAKSLIETGDVKHDEAVNFLTSGEFSTANLDQGLYGKGWVEAYKVLADKLSKKEQFKQASQSDKKFTQSNLLEVLDEEDIEEISAKFTDQILSINAPHSQIRVAQDLGKKYGEMLNTDPEVITNELVNIMSNAIDDQGNFLPNEAITSYMKADAYLRKLTGNDNLPLVEDAMIGILVDTMGLQANQMGVNLEQVAFLKFMTNGTAAGSMQIDEAKEEILKVVMEESYKDAILGSDAYKTRVAAAKDKRNFWNRAVAYEPDALSATNTTNWGVGQQIPRLARGTDMLAALVWWNAADVENEANKEWAANRYNRNYAVVIDSLIRGKSGQAQNKNADIFYNPSPELEAETLPSLNELIKGE